ncbi:hypothetical protein ACLOJK_005391 [Asimina triloba]
MLYRPWQVLIIDPAESLQFKGLGWSLPHHRRKASVCRVVITLVKVTIEERPRALSTALHKANERPT